MEIKVTNLTIAYGDAPAVDNISFEVPRGELLVLLGPSGCGKTSTMRSIVGLETPSGGSIEVSGRRLFDAEKRIDVPVNRRGISMIFQSYAIWPHKTVFQNVAFPLRMQHVPKPEIKERVEQTLELVGMEEYGSRSASKLSGGQMQRVALARGLVTKPRVLLLDEPLSNLDAKLRERLRYELKELQQTIGVTSIYVTHDQHEALVLADKLVVMSRGTIRQVGPPAEVFDKPSSHFVADFMGVSNLLPVTVARTAGDSTEVRFTEHPLTVVAAGLPSAGDDVSLCIRPEVLQLSEPDATAAVTGQNSWPATVNTVTFGGTHYRYSVTVDNGPAFDVVLYNQRAHFPAGSKVRLSVDPRDVRLILNE